MLKILKVSRLLRLTKGAKGLQSLLQTMEYSIPQIVNIVFLLFLFYFITACLAYTLFRQVISGTQLDPEIVNFKNFYRSIMTLFRASTGEDWQALLSDLWQTKDKACVEGETCAKYRKINFLE